jgi:cation diffusion facilitator family transporter
MIALLIGYESVTRFFAPVPIHFAEAIPVACLGLAVNVASAWLLNGSGHHGHSHGHDHAHEPHDEGRLIATHDGEIVLGVFEDGIPARFRLTTQSGPALTAATTSVETVRPDGARQLFAFVDKGSFLESVEEIPEPHSFAATVTIDDQAYLTTFEEHEHTDGAATRDNNMRAAVIHVIADATVSVLVIVGLMLAVTFGWLWMDPLAGMVGACVIASWAFGLVRDTGSILLDMNPDRRMADNLRAEIENEGDQIADLHLWRLGPGHLGAILSIITGSQRGVDYYRTKLARFHSLSHLTIELSHKP